MIAILVIHFLMFIAITVSIWESLSRPMFEKIALTLVALLIPIVGPIYVQYRLKRVIFVRGHYINTSGVDSDSQSSSDCGGASESSASDTGVSSD